MNRDWHDTDLDVTDTIFPLFSPLPSNQLTSPISPLPPLIEKYVVLDETDCTNLFSFSEE